MNKATSQKNTKKASNVLETWGNESTMNLNAIIYQNILSSPYFRSLYTKKTFHEIVDEIYNEVYVLTPFIKGTQPSTAFCCLFKMWTLRLTIKQIENLVDHVDSPYIRAIGFLYLRYVCAPAQLWDWFQYYLEDEEEITISGGINPTKITIGQLCRMLITEQKFQGTMLPRIPIPIARDLEKKLDEYDREKRKESKQRYDRDDDNEDRYYSRRDRSRSYRSRSRSRERRRDHHRDEFDEYERSRDRSRHYDRRRSISPDYSRRKERRYSRSRSRSRDHHRHSRERESSKYRDY
ncbi:MAG: putative RNA binding protein [Benjaminiella poitrasii]|nr:MAG: putative RNA binding protein [Benjaminiella poitrasii]